MAYLVHREVSCMHRTKQRGEKVAALTEKQSDLVQTFTSAAPKEVRDTTQKTKHCTLHFKVAS